MPLPNILLRITRTMLLLSQFDKKDGRTFITEKFFFEYTYLLLVFCLHFFSLGNLCVDDGKIRRVELFAGLYVSDSDERHEAKVPLVGALVVNVWEKDS